MKKQITWIAIGLTIATASSFGFGFAQSTALESTLRAEIDAIYKGDYRAAFVDKKPELFLKYIPDDFISESIEGQKFNAAGLRQFFPSQFPNMVKTIEHNVSFEDVDVISATKLSAVVTLNTLIEYKGAAGNYLVNTIGTYRDVWEKRNGKWFEIEGNQLRNQTTSYRRP